MIVLICRSARIPGAGRRGFVAKKLAEQAFRRGAEGSGRAAGLRRAARSAGGDRRGVAQIMVRSDGLALNCSRREGARHAGRGTAATCRTPSRLRLDAGLRQPGHRALRPGRGWRRGTDQLLTLAGLGRNARAGLLRARRRGGFVLYYWQPSQALARQRRTLTALVADAMRNGGIVVTARDVTDACARPRPCATASGASASSPTTCRC